MPVKIDMSANEWDAISRMEKDYKVLYETLEEITELVYLAPRARVIAQLALDHVTIKP